MAAHKLAYMFAHPEDDIGPGEVIRHSCDDRLCLTPAHLRRGTQQDNVDDMWERGRAHTNTLNPHRAAICADYAAGATISALARPYGVTTKAMREALRRWGVYQRVLPPGERTHCPQGHAYTPENTYVNPKGERECRACHRERTRGRRKR